MATDLTEDLNGVLRSLLGLYGAGDPAAGTSASLAQRIAADMSTSQGRIATGYSTARGTHTVAVEKYSGREGVVHKAVAESGTGTINGRGTINHQIADLQDRIRAIASVGDTRFSGPALLATAQSTISNATNQVNADVDAARRQAAQITPPTALSPVRHRTSSPRRRRRRYRPGGRRGRYRAPSTGTKGGRAVEAASAWLGTPYVWGGGGAGGPTGGGFDCSGLTQYAIAQASGGEVILPRTTYEQIYSGERIHPRDVQPGDLVFPAGSFSSRGPEHVQLAAGNGMVIEAPYTGSVVKWTPMTSDAVVVRVL
ncbi:C40 family peptidase [Nocardia cyriacigeorgica]|uniref:C40 family peptidase n=1 Tax=Nocardia cyriacigeorgica TaxID=135487 RepID=UPI0002F8A7F3|nr:C40 family peptidase [Nocardia cyriacigeorgica]TLF55291.1 peptidoglycan endopeptidase [Nocardia cyriacigeorgica]